MYETIISLLMLYGIKSLVVAKIIEGIGAARPTPVRGMFRNLLTYEIIGFWKIAIVGVPVAITVEMILSFIIGRALFSF